MNKKTDDSGNRRKFLKNTIAFGTAALTSGAGAVMASDNNSGKKVEKIKVLTSE
jgi:nitrous oxide reductase